MQYDVNRWTEDKEQSRAMVVNIPILIYHGKSPFTKMWLSDHFDEIPEAVKDYFPNFKVFTTDLNTYNDKQLIQLIGKSMLLNAFLAFKHCRNVNYILHNMEKLLIFMDKHFEVDRILAKNFFNALLLFLLNMLPEEKQTTFPQIIQQLPSEMKKEARKIYLSVYEANRKSDELNRKIEEMNKQMEIERQKAKQAQQKIEQERLKAEKKAKQVEQKAVKEQQEKITLIKHLVFVVQQPIETVAQLLKVSVAEIEKILKSKSKA